MNPFSWCLRVPKLCCILLLLPAALCHMEMSWPYPFRSKFNPENNYTNIDYSMTIPLNANGSNFPCKGYQNDGLAQITEIYTAGSTYNMSLAGTATHGGGSCQLSLSYDNGATFRVIKSMIGGCPLESTFNFTIPPYAPSSNSVLLAWSWQNFEGNRELYMNCARVGIVSPHSRRHHRKKQTSFDQLPYIWKANIAGLNDCATVEGVNPVYPNPGPDVVYANGMNSSDPATSGDCDAATPYGLAYMDPNSLNGPDGSSTAGNASIPTTTNTVVARSLEPNFSPPEANGALRQAQTPLFPRTSNTGNCLSAPIVTVFQSTPSTVTVTVVSTSILHTGSHFATEDVSWTTSPTTNSSSSSQPQNTFVITRTSTVVPTRSTSSRLASTTPSRPPYATGDLQDYLPCVPGTFICASDDVWQTCAYGDGSSWVYGYPRDVSAGMECLPWLSPYATATREYSQQSKTPEGYYRDDRIVRARPDGDCDDKGHIQCSDGGQVFDICDQGGWVQMGPVANGTICNGDGEIVAAS